MSEEQPRGRRGSIGVEIFEEVERIVSAEGITRSEAFQRISDASGRQPGTVAANYYRVARQRGAALAPRTRRAPGRPRRGRAAVSSDADAALSRAMSALEELSAIVRRQDQEIARLRDQGEQFDKFRKWMVKNTR